MFNFGFIQLNRNFMDWRWYSDGNTVRLFLHLLMSVNYEDKEFQDVTIRRGQRIVSLTKLADELNLSVHQIRTALEHLEKTGDVTRSSQGKFTIVTVNSYDDFILPSNERQSGGNETAEPRQADGSNVINNINKNNYNKDKKAAAPAEERTVRKTADPESLRRRYGEQNVRKYEEKLRRWMASKGIDAVGDFWGTVEKWMERDNVPKPVYSDGFIPEKYMVLVNNFKT